MTKQKTNTFKSLFSAETRQLLAKISRLNSILTSLIPSDDEAAAFGKKLQQVLNEYLDGKRDFKVIVKKADH